MGAGISTCVAGRDLPLWSGEPAGTWLREWGRTRVLVIDDQYCSRSRLLDVAEDSPPTPGEQALREWLNADIQFFPMPADYRWDGSLPTGSFDEAWFETTLIRLATDPEDRRPIAAVFLDLMFGDRQRTFREAAGRRFLGILRRHLPDVPVLILTNVAESPATIRELKSGPAPGGDYTFEDYVPKFDRANPDQPLLERLAHKLVWWADLSDPGVCAFAPKSRRLARQMRRVVLQDEQIDYEVPGDRFPRPVVLEGEFGAGKNYLAEYLVRASARQANPCQTVTFSGTADDAVFPKLFGTGPYTGAPFLYGVDPRTGAVVRRLLPRDQPDGLVPLAQYGALHAVDIAGQPPGRQEPLRGSLILDELGLASERMQGTLLGVFNDGRFSPHLLADVIPTTRRLDVWFLVTASPRTRDRMLPDLLSRLGKAHWLTIPGLSDRGEDVLPLALQKLGTLPPASPDDVFTEDARHWLADAAPSMQVRELTALALKLPDVTAKRPYSRRDLEKGLAAARPAPRSDDRDRPAGVATSGPVATPTDPDPMTWLARWAEDGGVAFRADIGRRESVERKGSVVDAGAAAARLAYLELAVRFTRRPDAPVSPVAVYEFQYGEKLDTHTARSRLGEVFREAPEEQSLRWLARSDELAALAIDLAGRAKAVQGLLDKLAADGGQEAADRLRRLGYPTA